MGPSIPLSLLLLVQLARLKISAVGASLGVQPNQVHLLICLPCVWAQSVGCGFTNDAALSTATAHEYSAARNARALNR